MVELVLQLLQVTLACSTKKKKKCHSSGTVVTSVQTHFFRMAASVSGSAVAVEESKSADRPRSCSKAAGFLETGFDDCVSDWAVSTAIVPLTNGFGAVPVAGTITVALLGPTKTFMIPRGEYGIVSAVDTTKK